MKRVVSNRSAATLLAVGVFLLSLWRAGTQSITGDEAFAYELFVSSHPAKLFNHYDASHHVLYAILQKITVTLFGVSEFTLRLPAVAGAALYLSVAVRLCHRLFGESPRLPLGVALLTLNPLVLDFLSAARGYGLALALLLWALEQMWIWAEAPSEVSALRAAAGLSLSVSSNLTFAFPAAPAALIFLATVFLDRRAAGRRWRMGIECFLVPGVVLAFLILVMPLVHARRDHFYVGHTSLEHSVKSLAALSLFPHPKPWAPSENTFWVNVELRLFVWLVIPLAIAVAALVWFAACWRFVRSRTITALSEPERLHLFSAGALLGSVGLLIFTRRFFGLPYPHGRTGLYLILLTTLCGLILWRMLHSRSAPRWATLSIGLALSLLVAQYVVFLQTKHYTEWRYASSVKEVMAILRFRPSAGPVRVAASPFLEPSLNFYRKLWRMNWMAPVRREKPDREATHYVLLTEDHGLIVRRRLRVLFEDPFSGVVLAVPRDRITTP